MSAALFLKYPGRDYRKELFDLVDLVQWYDRFLNNQRHFQSHQRDNIQGDSILGCQTEGKMLVASHSVNARQDYRDWNRN